jgi:hypothetical protein
MTETHQQNFSSFKNFLTFSPQFFQLALKKNSLKQGIYAKNTINFQKNAEISS